MFDVVDITAIAIISILLLSFAMLVGFFLHIIFTRSAEMGYEAI